MSLFAYYLDMNIRLILFSSIAKTATDLWFVVASHSGRACEGVFKTPFFYLIRIPLMTPFYNLREVLRAILEKNDPDRYCRIMRDVKKYTAALAEAERAGRETAKIKEELEFLEQTLFYYALCDIIHDKDLVSLSHLTSMFRGSHVSKYNNERTVLDLSESDFYVELKDRATRCLGYLEAVSGRHVDYDPRYSIYLMIV